MKWKEPSRMRHQIVREGALRGFFGGDAACLASKHRKRNRARRRRRRRERGRRRGQKRSALPGDREARGNGVAAGKIRPSKESAWAAVARGADKKPTCGNTGWVARRD